MMDIVEGEGYRLYRGDCLEVMAGMPDASVNLIATDPPYFRVKDEPWDRQWDSRDAFLAWLGRVADEWRRILKPNGSLYVFASPQMAWYVEGVIRERFSVLNVIDWVKDAGWHQKSSEETLRCYFPQKETIIFAEQFNSDNVALGESGYERKCDELRGFIFEPLRAYLDAERLKAGLSVQDVAEAWRIKTGNINRTGMAGHWFSEVQWTLPTKENYEWLRITLSNLNHGGEYLRREYEYLRREYEDLRREYEDLRREYEDLRRPFNATPDAPYTDAWTFPTVQTYPGKHPCEKPLALMEHIVSLSSRPGDVVLDCFSGSNTTGVAARGLGREYTGIEMSDYWHRRGHRRLIDASRAARGLPKQLKDNQDYAHMPLFAGALGDDKQLVNGSGHPLLAEEVEELGNDV